MSDSKKSPADELPPVTPADISVVQDKGGFVLRDQDGMALYRYDRDADGKPTCVGACATTWPPVLATAGSSDVVGEFKTIKRGTARQWTFRGKPIYTYSKDTPGSAKGDGVGGVWHLVSL